MTAFVHWVLAQRYRLIVLAIAVAPLLPTLTAGLIALETLYRDTATGARSGAYVLLGSAALSLASGASVALVVAIGAVTVAAGLGVGALLRASRSLLLTFQATLMLSLVVVLALVLFGPDAASLFGSFVDEAADLMRERGATPDQILAVRSWQDVLLGLIVAAAFAQIVAAALLGLWWWGLESGDAEFGAQFRSLRLGRVLGVPGTFVIGLSLFMNVALIQNLAPVLLAAFLFQGLAVVHAWAHARSWHVAVLGLMYLLMVTPVFGVLILLLGLIGLVDNWFDLRARVRSRA